MAPGTLTSREAARPPVRDSASPRVSPRATRRAGHGVLDGLVVDAEDDVAGALVDHPATRPPPRRAAPVRRRACAARTVTRTLIPSMPLARKAIVAERSPSAAIAARRWAPQRLGQARLAHPPGADDPADDGRLLAPLGHRACRSGAMARSNMSAIS